MSNPSETSDERGIPVGMVLEELKTLIAAQAGEIAVLRARVRVLEETTRGTDE